MKKEKLLIAFIAVFAGCLIFLFTKNNLTGGGDVTVTLDSLTRAESGDRIQVITEINSDVRPVSLPDGAGGNFTKADFLRLLDKPVETPIEEFSAAGFFDGMVEKRDWQTDQQRFSAARFTSIREYFDVNLTGVRMFKVGEIEKTVFIVGSDRSGNLVGIYFFTVET